MQLRLCLYRYIIDPLEHVRCVYCMWPTDYRLTGWLTHFHTSITIQIPCWCRSCFYYRSSTFDDNTLALPMFVFAWITSHLIKTQHDIEGEIQQKLLFIFDDDDKPTARPSDASETSTYTNQSKTKRRRFHINHK